MELQSLNSLDLALASWHSEFHALVEAQKFMRDTKRDIKMLVRAFKKLTRLSEIDVELAERSIGTHEVFHRMGVLVGGEVEYGASITLPLLVEALTESAVRLESFKIRQAQGAHGYEDEFCELDELPSERRLKIPLGRNVRSAILGSRGLRDAFPEEDDTMPFGMGFPAWTAIFHPLRVLELVGLNESSMDPEASTETKNAVMHITMHAEKLEKLVLVATEHNVSPDTMPALIFEYIRPELHLHYLSEFTARAMAATNDEWIDLFKHTLIR